VNMHKMLMRNVQREELARIEDSARTQADFENVALMWDKLDENRERRERYYELPFSSVSEKSAEFDERTYSAQTIIPLPLRHRLWRQLMSGYFLDVIFDCPYEIDELVSGKEVSTALKSLNDNQKEILYFRIVRDWMPQKIAVVRGQTDRNIRKVYEMAIDSIRRKLRTGK